MADLSTVGRNRAYNFLLRDNPVKVALFVGPLATDEVVAGGYARVDAPMGVPNDGAGANAADVLVGPLEGTGTVTHSALCDAANGDILTQIKPVSIQRTWNDGDTLRFRAGEIDFAIA